MRAVPVSPRREVVEPATAACGDGGRRQCYGAFERGPAARGLPPGWARARAPASGTFGTANEFVDLCVVGADPPRPPPPKVDEAARAALEPGDVSTVRPVRSTSSERLVATSPTPDWNDVAKKRQRRHVCSASSPPAPRPQSDKVLWPGSYQGIAGWSLGPDATGMTPQDHDNTIGLGTTTLASVEAR